MKSAAAGVCSMYQWCKIRGVTKNVEIESMYTPEVKERTLQHTDYTLYTGFMGRFSATLGYSKKNYLYLSTNLHASLSFCGCCQVTSDPLAQT